MKFLNLGIISALLLSSSALFAQGEIDAYRYSQTGLNGTARYLGMGGAFGALGGDISAMSSNPGGLAIYRSSEIVTTLSLSSVNTETAWSSVMKEGRTKFKFDNIAYVGYFPTANSSGIMGWNVGFAYNRVNSFERNYTAHGSGSDYQTYSMADYIGERAFGTSLGTLKAPTDNFETDPYNNADWLTVLGFEGGLITPYNDSDSNDEYTSSFFEKDADGNRSRYSPSSTKFNVQERGSTDKYDFSAATNISDMVFIGATLSVTDISYRSSITYEEGFESINSDMYLDNELNTNGTGFGVNVGVIIRPVDFLRFGVAFNSPTWYQMTDYYKGAAGSYYSLDTEKPRMDAKTPQDAYSNYQLSTPERWIFSAAAVFKRALISVDYELTNFNSMKLFSDNGEAFTNTNSDIKADYGLEHLVKIGAELKVTSQFSVRAGAGFRSSAIEQDLADNKVEVLTVGTIPNYTIDKGSNYYTVGLGYRFTPRFYTDLAYVYNKSEENIKLFSNIYDENGDALVSSEPIAMKTVTSRFALTLGYKF